MSDSREIQEIFDDFLESVKALETNIVSTVSDTNTDIEMVLRELLVYLNSTSNFLEEIQKEIDSVNTSSAKMAELPGEVRALTKEIDSFVEKQTNKIIEIIKKVYGANNKALNSIGSYTKKVNTEVEAANNKIDQQLELLTKLNLSIESMNTNIEKTEETIKKNQEDFMKIVNRVFDTKMEKMNIESKSNQSEYEIKKEKIILWGKIAALILGSSGVVYLVLSSLLGS